MSTHHIVEEFNVNLIIADSESVSDKWKAMGLDQHLQVSTMVKLIDKYRGASNYLNDRSYPTQVNKVLALRAVSKIERLNVQNFVDAEYVKLHSTHATHIVVSVTYGAEAYCVLTCDIDSTLDDEGAREEADSNLLNIANKLKNALDDNTFDFLKKINKEEKQRLTNVKCRLYADIQTQAVRECNVTEAYKYCTKLIEQIKTDDNEKMTKSVPITAWLYPFKKIC